MSGTDTVSTSREAQCEYGNITVTEGAREIDGSQ